MEGPLPPHEREWRHPSELGPPTHEPTDSGRRGRILIVSTATLGLLLVGALAVTMTPRRSSSPVAANSTALGLRARPPTASARLPLVTPIGDDGWAITTAEALADVRGPMVRVQLATGGIIDVEIVRTADDVTLVSLPAGTDTASFDVADADPSGDDTVVLHRQDEPVSVAMGELASAELAEATPVLDPRGRLVGLATGEPDAHWMIAVDTLPPAPTVQPTVSTLRSTSAAPTTSVGAASSVVAPTTTTTTTTTTAPATTTATTATIAPASPSSTTTRPTPSTPPVVSVVVSAPPPPTATPTSVGTSALPVTPETAPTPPSPSLPATTAWPNGAGDDGDGAG